MSFKEQLQSKFLISVEGNDVVFMQKPTIYSWCMGISRMDILYSIK